MADVVELPWFDGVDRNPDLVLEQSKGKLKKVLILGYDQEDDEYSNISFESGSDALWLVEWARDKILAQARKLREERGQ